MLLVRRLVAGLAFLGAAVLGAPGARAADAPAAGADVIGDPNAPVTIIEYASLGCPHCAAFWTGTLPELKKRYIDTGKAKLEFRDFPLDEVALRAHQIARCAGPERRERYLDVFFRQQAGWARAKDPVAAIRQIGKLGGMSDDQVKACLADKAVEDSILNARLEGEQKYNVNSTPTFVINGKSYAGTRTVDEFGQLIDPLVR